MTSGALSSVAAPVGWSWRSLWSAMTRQKRVGQPGLRPLSVFLDAGVVPRDSRGDNHNRLGEDLAKYLVVQPGDVVFNKLRTWQGGIGSSSYRGIVSPAYYVCRPDLGYDSRYLHYLLRSTPYLAELTRISKYMPPSQFDTPWETLRLLPILTPPLEEQRRIADFLDAETSRIDRLVALQRQVVERLNERDAAVRDVLIDRMANRRGELPLRRFILKIEQGVSPQCESAPRQDSSEWSVLKLSAVKGGVFRPGENKLLPGGTAPSREYEVRPGDLLATRANTPELVGDVAVVSSDCARLLLPDLIYRIGLTEAMDAEYVTQVALGGRVRSVIEAAARGSSGSMVKLRGEDIRSWPVPPASLSEQHELVREISLETVTTGRLRALLSRQIDLLAERRQSLITAAVTGQFDVTTASGRNLTQGV